MSQQVNKVVLGGHLTRDPELRSTTGGTPVCSLRIANNRRMKSGEEWKDRVGYFDVTVWGRQGENCATYLAKGRAVMVVGELRWREWDSEHGKRQAIEINADEIQFLGGGDGSVRERVPEPDVVPDTSGMASQPVREGQTYGSFGGPDDDIPF